jgi:exonuclease VII large subunit
MSTPDLRSELALAEAEYAAVKRKVDELERQQLAQEDLARTELNKKMAAITTSYEKRRAEISQLGRFLRERLENVLSQSKELEIKALRQSDKEQADARKKRHKERKQQYDNELLTAITALVRLSVSQLCPVGANLPTSC